MCCPGRERRRRGAALRRHPGRGHRRRERNGRGDTPRCSLVRAADPFDQTRGTLNQGDRADSLTRALEAAWSGARTNHPATVPVVETMKSGVPMIGKLATSDRDRNECIA